MAAAIKTFMNQSLLVVGGDNFFLGQWLAALGTKHEVILSGEA